MSYYLDDTLIREKTREEAQRNIHVFGSLLQRAGFLLHKKKSLTVPTQKIEYLGFLIDSCTMTLDLPVEKEERLRRLVRRALTDLKCNRRIMIRTAARVIGTIISSVPETAYGRGHFRELEEAKKVALENAGGRFNAKFRWQERQRSELQWWLDLPSPIPASFEEWPFGELITTDASLEGWGAVWGKKKAYGSWEIMAPIDELELMAVLAAI